MSLDLNTTITGNAMTGLTTPTYTLATDNPPQINARQSIVTTLGGTQTGVRTHAPSDPFTLTAIKPLKPIGYPRANPVTGAIPQVGRNKYILKLRKGLIPLAGQNPQLAEFDLTCQIPAGAEVNDQINIAAALSALTALINREGPNLFVMVKTANI
jgi:hypothetical protein